MVAIYLIRRDDGSNLIKIGYSCVPRSRVADISRDAGCKVSLIWQSCTEHGSWTERQLHKLFHYWRREGEWFYFGKVDPVPVICAAMSVVDRLGRDPKIQEERRVSVWEMVMLPDGMGVGEKYGPPYAGAW